MNAEEKKMFSSCKAIVCDLDGTLYLEGKPVPGAIDFLNRVLESGRKLYYFTNNSSSSRDTYLAKLDKIGFPCEDEYLITSADCADSYLKRNKLFPEIYLIGNRDLVSDFTKRGYRCMTDTEVKETLPKAVVMGFDTELNYQKLCTGYDLMLTDIPYIATHADILCPVTKSTFKPDVGSFISLFETATGGRLPRVVGKPHKEAVEAISERAEMDAQEIAFIGDRLYTDIRMAQQFDMVGVLVMSGETTPEMLEKSSDQPKITVSSVLELIDVL